jgi:hypothetical protein
MEAIEGDGGGLWQFSLRQAESTIESALAQRSADRVNHDFVPNDWAHIGQEVYGWARAKTYLAAVLCGLVARATDARADPLSLQVGEHEGGYAATSLWQVIQVHTQGRIDLKQLKSQPFNNSPFTGKRRIERDWQNVAAFNRPRLDRTIELLESVATMTDDEARDALRSFLFTSPDAKQVTVLRASVAEGSLDLSAFFEALDTFLLDDGENGRRAQAMVAAAFGLVHGELVDTPRSINDPSRGQPGDVRVVRSGDGESPRALFAEAKQKTTPPEWVDQFADEIHAHSIGGTMGYAALVNARASVKGRRLSELPDWREVLKDRGVVSAIWTNPADMVRDAIIWSALDAHTAIVRFVELYASYLVHVETTPSTVEQWRLLAKSCGIETTQPN